MGDDGIDNSDSLLELNPRDDLESLAFVLLYLLRGDHKICSAGTAALHLPK